jgi:hypothetical protein
MMLGCSPAVGLFSNEEGGAVVDRQQVVAAPQGWVPVDRRWLGLDRRTIAPGVLVLALAVILIFVVPAVDEAVPGGRPVRPGERLGLNGGVQFRPASGWTIVDGVAVGQATRSGSYPSSAELVDGPMSFAVTTGKFSGNPAQLLAQIEATSERAHAGPGASITGIPRPMRAAAGVTGVVAQTGGASTSGLIGAFVIDGTGVEVVATRPHDVRGDPADDVGAMIKSIAPLTGARS